MQINRLKITRLFDLFDYDINFDNQEKLTIITGPNGFGKTMILNILFSLFNKRFSFFFKLVFKELEVFLDDNHRIQIIKSLKDKVAEVSLNHFRDGVLLDKAPISNEKEGRKYRDVFENFMPYLKKIADNQWIDRRSIEQRVLNFDEIIQENIHNLPDSIIKNIKPKLKEETFDLINSVKIHLIKEQRLFKLKSTGYNETSFSNTIEDCAKELKTLIDNKEKEHSQITSRLDSTFPKRFLETKKDLSQIEFNNKFNELKKKQERLEKYGLSETHQSVSGIDDSDQSNLKFLSVYLDDLEDKLTVFDALLNKIELFTDILNERRLNFKKIEIDRDKGFVCKNSNGKLLSLQDLSSGEQHEIVLLYELIFKTNPDTLVLIDEPEISLHIAWQNEFIDDLLKIIKLQNIQAIVATHAPGIINNHGDLKVDLFEQTKR
jgi:predicted ATP-binding protein involved in virulence